MKIKSPLFWVYHASTYCTDSPELVKDSTGKPLTGLIQSGMEITVCCNQDDLKKPA